MCHDFTGENRNDPRVRRSYMLVDALRWKLALEKLDGKVQPGWRQAVITQALRPLDRDG